MSYSLTLKTDRSEFSVPLYPEPPDLLGDSLPIDRDETHIILSKSEYTLTIPELKEDCGIRILLNDAVPRDDENCGKLDGEGKGRLQNGEICVGRMFDDVWGFVQLRITLYPDSPQKQELFSEFIRVQTSRTDSNAFLQMAEYVYQSLPPLLVSNGEKRSKVETELRRAAITTLDLQLNLIRRTISVYRKQRSFFRESAVVKTDREYTVDDARRLQRLTPESLRYAAVHPEQLTAAGGQQGIQVRRGIYLPQKILMERNALVWDTEENRAVLGFLPLLVREIQAYEELIADALKEKTENTDFRLLKNGGFEPSAYLKEKKEELPQLRQQLKALTISYEDVFQMVAPKTMSRPRPTAVFRSVPQYREIYDLITAWYRGVFDFSRQRFLLQCIGSSRLYESYVLVCFYRYFEREGYKISSYVQDWGEKCLIHNVFSFTSEDGKTTVTLYYEPVIRSNGESRIGLRRKSSGTYTPDYVLKIEKSDNVRTGYVICDAKFSSYDTTRMTRYPDIWSKYVNDISIVGAENHDRKKEEPAPVCIVYGEYQEKDPVKTRFGETVLYEDGSEKYRPNAMIIPVSPALEDNEGAIGGMISELSKFILAADKTG